MAETGKNGYYIQHTAAADGAGVAFKCRLQGITWFGFTNAAHTLQVKDASGNIILPAMACGAAATVIGPIHIPLDIPANGIETDVLGSGTVIYHLR